MHPSSEQLVPLEVLAYSLGRPETLTLPWQPPSGDELAMWIRKTELDWLPCAEDLMRACSAAARVECADEWQFVTHLVRSLREVVSSDFAAAADGELGLRLRRALPASTIEFLIGNTIRSSSLADVEADRIAVECADIHVHQGGALGFDRLVRLLIDSYTTLGEASWAESRGITIEVDGRGLLAPPLVAGMILAAGDVDDPALVGALVGRAATEDIDAWARLSELTQGLAAVPEGNGTTGVDLKRALDRSASRDSLLLFLKCESVLYRGVTQMHAGLDRFVSAFERLGRLRRSTAVTRSRYLRDVLDGARRESDGLCHVDLRLGESISRGWQAGNVASSVMPFLDAYRAYLGESPNPVTVRFPLGLIKSAIEPAEEWRWNLAPALELIDDFLGFLSESDALWELTNGIDVCGDERAVPNWVLTPVVDEYVRAAARAGRKVDLRFHAGESFWHPVQGVRSVWEALTLARGQCHARIGHGLALASEDFSDLDEEPLDAALDDLLFCYAVASPLVDHSLLARLRREINDVARLCYGDPFDEWISARGVDFLRDAYLERLLAQTYRDVGMTAEVLGRVAFADGHYLPRPQSLLDLVGAHLRTNGCERSSVAEVYPSKSRLRSVLSDLYGCVSTEVLRQIQLGGAVLEVCPSSNLTIGGIRGMARHPVQRFVASRVRVAVGSDDPAIFHSWLAAEVRILAQSGLMSVDDLELARVAGLEMGHGATPGGDRLLLEAVLRERA